MATGRTISASYLTDSDNMVIELCKAISTAIYNSIADEEFKKEFKKEYGKISFTRDSGLGLGGGKLQRDAVCTRGRQGKAPFSNRNLRWHPLMVAAIKPDFARKIERIEIEGEDESQVLVFVIKDDNNREIKYPSDKVHEIKGRFVALPEHWYPHIDELKHWSDTLWTQNSCAIPALEACNWFDSIETYAVLGIALAVDLYGVNFETLYEEIINILQNQNIDGDINLPSAVFPSDKADIIKCPICRLNISQDLAACRRTLS